MELEILHLTSEKFYWASTASQAPGGARRSTIIADVINYSRRCVGRLAPGEMELGLGIHGEPGACRGPAQPIDAIVAQVRPGIPPETPNCIEEPAGNVVCLSLS